MYAYQSFMETVLTYDETRAKNYLMLKEKSGIILSYLYKGFFEVLNPLAIFIFQNSVLFLRN